MPAYVISEVEMRDEALRRRLLFVDGI